MNLLFQSTRRRLALWYTSVTAVLLLVFAIGVYIYVRTTLVDRIDDTLKHVVEVVDRSLVVQPLAETKDRYGVNLDASFNQNANSLEDDHIDLEWFNPQQILLWSTFEHPIDHPLHTGHSSETVYLDRDHIFRQIVQKVELDHHVLGYLRVSHPWFEVTKPINQLTRDLIIGTSLMVISVGSIGWFLSGIAIKPIQTSYSSLKQFTADASHELRNPIATIQTNVQMALAYPEAEPQLQKRQLQIIERLTQKLGRLVNDLLFLARSDSGMVQMDWQTVPLDALLIDVIEEQRIAATQKGLFLSLHIVEPKVENEFNEEEVFNVLGDWNYLSRLFTNLIANAIEHSDKLTKSSDASVEVELELIRAMPKTMRVRESIQKYELQVKIADDGHGIPDTSIPQIFDRFYRADPARSAHREINTSTGAGLGLVIAKAIVENHQGQITVESVVDQGTTFIVKFPQASTK